MKTDIIINDRHEFLSVYTSQCARCRYFNFETYTCKAYPIEIPESLLSGEEKHDKVRADQEGTTTFEKEP